jgi:hypothetical protein
MFINKISMFLQEKTNNFVILKMYIFENMKLKYSLIILIFFISIQTAFCQLSALFSDTTKNNDTIYYRKTSEVIIRDKMMIRSPQEQEAYHRLKQKVIKLYPYALLAKKIYNNSYQEINKLESNKEKRKFKKEKEKALRQRFENEIKGLYDTDGPILVKLIHRETGKTCHELLKEIKGGFNVFFYQIVAKRYGYSLKETFDPEKDKDIENMVQFLKSEGQLPIYID